MMGMNSYGTVQAIGANCTFRRAALDSIGGHAPGLSEDMHTAMQLHAKGWKSVYLPEVLTIGLVPSSLSAFFQQQLKWSRGTFELLFTTYLKLFRHFTWRQKLHYFTIALYFLGGIITLIDILVPVLALVLAKTVWQIDLSDFLMMFLPLFGISILIPMYSQKWLAQQHERGFHLAGGILQTGTWWIYNLGFLCTLLRIKIPYIPTPKDDEPRNDWMISLPNLITAMICFLAIVYGLQLDYSPFSIFMASFACLNGCFLIFISIMAQQKLINTMNAGIISRLPSLKRPLAFLRSRYESLTSGMLKIIMIPTLLLLTCSLIFAGRIEFLDSDYGLEAIKPPIDKHTGGFYTGIYLPEVEKKSSFKKLFETEKQLETSFDIISLYMAWGPESGAAFPDSMLREIVQRGSIPMITWEPWTWPFPEYKKHPELCCEKKVLRYIYEEYFDQYLLEYALQFKKLKGPVMLRFAHEFDNPAYPWSEAGGNTPEDFKRCWKYVVNYFDSLGVGNVTWVWNPWEEDQLDKYYPGDEYVDWIGVTNLNYGLAA